MVRRLVGYERYSTHQAHAKMNDLYDVVRLYCNFFQPVLKLVAAAGSGGAPRQQESALERSEGCAPQRSAGGIRCGSNPLPASPDGGCAQPRSGRETGTHLPMP